MLWREHGGFRKVLRESTEEVIHDDLLGHRPRWKVGLAWVGAGVAAALRYAL